jgi:YhcH/YjgK/YiaL family protein
MALFGSIASIRIQAAHAAGRFAAAFAYLDDLFRPDSPVAVRLRALTEGETRRIELTGGAFALEQAYRSKARAEGFFESHRRYIDVQVVFDGEEIMEVGVRGRMTVSRAYDAERDLIVYLDTTAASRLRLGAGEAAVFYPEDVHMPSLCLPAGPALVRKTVIKVPVAE